MIASLDLYVEEPVLGHETRFVREAGISFGMPKVGPVADNELPALDRRRPDLGRWRFTLVTLPFDLKDLPTGRRYVEATVRMAFDAAEMRVTCGDADARDILGGLPSYRDADGDADVGTSGVGYSVLNWKLTPRDEERGIRPTGWQVSAVLESPLASPLLTGTLDGNVRFTRRWFDRVERATAEPRRPLRFILNVASGDCTIFPFPQ